MKSIVKNKRIFRNTDSNLLLSPAVGIESDSDGDKENISENDIIVRHLQRLELTKDDTSFITGADLKENIEILND